MVPHAGFAAVIGLRQRVIQDRIDVAYHANLMQHQLLIVKTGVTGNLFLDTPQIELKGTHPDRLILHLVAWGPLTLSRYWDHPPELADSETRDVKFEASILISIAIDIVDEKLRFKVSETPAILESWQLNVFEGTQTYSPDIRDFLDSPTFQSNLPSVLQSLVESADLLPSLQIPSSTVSSISANTITRVSAKAFEGILVVGLDVSSGNVSTSGNAGQLSNGIDDMDIGIWENPISWLDRMKVQVKKEIVDNFENQGGSFHNASLRLILLNYLQVSGKGTIDGATVFFILAITPVLDKERFVEYVGYDEFWNSIIIRYAVKRDLEFKTTIVYTNVDLPWYKDLLNVFLEILTFGAWTINIGIQPASLANKFPMQGTKEEHDRTRHYRIRRYEYHPVGVFAGITEYYKYRKPKIVGQRWIAIEDIEAADLKYTVRLPYSVHVDDYQLRIRWTVKKTDNSIVLTSDEQAQGNEFISLSGIKDILYTDSVFKIECRVYRTRGTEVIPDLYNGFTVLKIADRLDKSQPYVYWQHYALTPTVIVELDGSKTIIGYSAPLRRSRIHRTDFPGRCRMASRYSLGAPYIPGRKPPNYRPARRFPPGKIYYLGQLPFRLSRLEHNRAKVCDYCFFGGPTNTRPLPLP